MNPLRNFHVTFHLVKYLYAYSLSHKYIYIYICYTAVNYLTDGINEALVEKIEKNSPSLGRQAVYTKTTKIDRLPKYLTVNFVRFFWKPQERIKAKILRVRDTGKEKSIS